MLLRYLVLEHPKSGQRREDLFRVSLSSCFPVTSQSIIPGSRGSGFTPAGSLLLLLNTLAITREMTSKKMKTNFGCWKTDVAAVVPVRGSMTLTCEDDPVALASMCSAGDLTCAMVVSFPVWRWSRCRLEGYRNLLKKPTETRDVRPA